MKPIDLSSLDIKTGSTKYVILAENLVDLCIRSDKPFRVYVCSEEGRVCIGPKADGDLSFDGRFRMIQAEWFAIHTMKSALVGVRVQQVATSSTEVPDPTPVEIPVPVQLSQEQKIALEVERRLSGDKHPGTPMEFLDDEDELVDWDDWSPYMESEAPPDEVSQSYDEQRREAPTAPDVKPKAAEQPAKAGEVDKGTAVE